MSATSQNKPAPALNRRAFVKTAALAAVR